MQNYHPSLPLSSYVKTLTEKQYAVSNDTARAQNTDLDEKFYYLIIYESKDFIDAFRFKIIAYNIC